MSKTAGTALSALSAGTAEATRQPSQPRRYALALMQELGATETEATRITDAFFRVMAHEGDRLHRNVVVCTHCEREVDALNFEARGRLDTTGTESAARMIDQAQAQAGPFRAELESRGVKI